MGSSDFQASGGQELEAAARVLGVTRMVQLGFGDSGMPGTPHNQRPGAFRTVGLRKAVDALRAVLEEERPDVLVTYDETGGYGYPDHVKAHQVAIAAFETSAIRKLYFVSFPLGWSRHFVAALRAAGVDAPGSAPAGADAGPSVAEIGVPDERVTTAIDVSAYVEVKRAALTCHRSQIRPDHFLLRAPRGLLSRLWAWEFFERAAGPTMTPPGEQEHDLFDGLDLV